MMVLFDLTWVTWVCRFARLLSQQRLLVLVILPVNFCFELSVGCPFSGFRVLLNSRMYSFVGCSSCALHLPSESARLYSSSRVCGRPIKHRYRPRPLSWDGALSVSACGGSASVLDSWPSAVARRRPLMLEFATSASACSELSQR